MSSLSNKKEEITIKNVITKAHEYIEDEEQIKIIEKAYDFALQNMKGNIVKVEKHIFIIH